MRMMEVSEELKVAQGSSEDRSPRKVWYTVEKGIGEPYAAARSHPASD
jgi:hypothetical protein